MSYEEFRKRIDTARQILVGAVPSPAGQIDQITYALMYKFMNDIDDESVSYGGKRQYFTGEYEKFNWHNLMAPSLEAYDRLELYRQAIQGMAKNPNIPELFREIYQNAFLPFNSPNVLTLFLNEINKFSHGDSDDIGDAYEYLLSITGAQGDVGQFRTPRHIIKFIVEAVNPTKTDKVLDPAVGTAGFLIAAYNHVKTQHDGKHNLAPLTADDKTKLHKNYRGYDIDPTMVRTASVNMYLHGFAKPDIRNHDTLSSTDYWDERFDVILANPPFMTPKGGIQPHKKFSIKASRAEVLFVDYIANHLNPVSGRAGIVVPEGIIFQSGKAYKELRKKLVEEYLYAVVSLPAGVFQPYSGVKTSVLLFDRELAKKKQDILFVKVENDGFSLGAQRRAVSGDQLPEALAIIEKYQAGETFESSIAHVVSRADIAESGDYNLSGDRYTIQERRYDVSSNICLLSDVLKISTGKKDVNQGNPDGKYPFFTCAKDHTYSDGFSYDKEAILIAGNGDVGSVKYYKGKFEAYQRTYILSDFTKDVLPLYVFYVLKQCLKPTLEMQKLGNTMPYIKLGMLADFKIPLPPLDIQRQIVAELDGYQKIIDAANTIVQSYKPTIKINPDWELVRLADIFDEIKNGKNVRQGDTGTFMVSRIQTIAAGTFNVDATKRTSDEIRNDDFLRKGDILMSHINSYEHLGKTAIFNCNERVVHGVNLLRLRHGNKVVPEYALYIFKTESFLINLRKFAQKAVNQASINSTSVKNLKIPLPPLDIQRQIVAELEAEQELINANKKLIDIYTQKIKTKLAEIWGE